MSGRPDLEDEELPRGLSAQRERPGAAELEALRLAALDYAAVKPRDHGGLLAARVRVLRLCREYSEALAAAKDKS